MGEISFLTYLAPGSEAVLLIIGLALVVFGVGVAVYVFVRARQARNNKAASVKLTVKADAFQWSIQGLYCLVIGGLLVAANFAPYSTTSMIVALVCFAVFFGLTGLLTWRYVVADRNAAEARAFDRAVWHFFNG